MYKPLSILRCTLLAVIFAVAACSHTFAQQKQTPPKKSSDATTTCEGALDIVPTKSMTFARKRRPAKTDSKQQPAGASPVAPADSKAQPKPPVESKSGK